MHEDDSSADIDGDHDKYLRDVEGPVRRRHVVQERVGEWWIRPVGHSIMYQSEGQCGQYHVEQQYQDCWNTTLIAILSDQTTAQQHKHSINRDMNVYIFLDQNLIKLYKLGN